ncbi:hypothetical protein F4814DRAFT_452605 [Daldinia grandis]|nr:hypothetical protein F4814DRAFT_452605 [Daldinia grandis]
MGQTPRSPHRDLGFTGELQGKWYAIYDDALWRASGVTDPTTDPDADGAGGVFYPVNANDAGLKGASIAKSELANGEPTVTQRFGDNGHWWPPASTPRYGDVTVFRDPRFQYVYAWGGAPTSVTDSADAQYVYLLRVKVADVYALDRYEYWWGPDSRWKTEQPLAEFGVRTAVAWLVDQGQVAWSEFYECYIFVHLSHQKGGSDVLPRTATSLEGPWTPDVKVFTATPIDGGLTYAGVTHTPISTQAVRL